MMTPEQMIAFHEDEADKCLASTHDPEIREDAFLLALNYQLAHQSAFAAALIKWRLALGDSRPALRKAYDICCSAIRVLPGMSSPEPLPSRFRFYDNAHLAVLLGQDVPREAGDVLERCRQASDIHTALDVALALAIVTQQPALLKTTIERHSFPKRLQLYRRTYETYARLLAGDVSALADAEENYKNRCRDDYYSEGFLIDGGGLDNAVAVDYRLAAIIKARGFHVSSVHCLSDS